MTVAASESTSSCRSLRDPPISRTARSAAAVEYRSSMNSTGRPVLFDSSSPTTRASAHRGVSSPLPSSGSPITNPRASSASARRTISATGGRLPAARHSRCPTSARDRRSRWSPSALLSLHHLLEELLVVFRARHLLEQEFHRFGLRHVGEEIPEEIDAIEFFLREEQFLFSRSRTIDVDCRKHATIGDLAVEDELHV